MAARTPEEKAAVDALRREHMAQLRERIAVKHERHLAVQAAKAAAAAERAEVRRLRRQLLQPAPPPKPPAPLSVAEQREALTQAIAAREGGDARAPQALLREAEDAVRAARPPRPARGG